MRDDLGMPLPFELLGEQVGPITTVVDERRLMAYAAGIGDLAPALVDTTAPNGIVGHPMFAVALEWPAVTRVRRLPAAAALTREEAARGVHANHDLVVHRLVRPGDELTTTATVAAVESRAPGAYQVLRLDTVDATGAPVATTHMGSLFLGVETAEGSSEGRREAPPSPAVPAVPEPPPFRPWRGPRLATTPRAISAAAALVYTECSGIWNPIHSDPAVARSAGLPAPILHGTATLAMAVSELVRVASDGDYERVRRVSCRFGAMVTMPSTIVIRVLHRAVAEPGRDGEVLSFDVRNARGEAAIDRGTVLLATG